MAHTQTEAAAPDGPAGAWQTWPAIPAAEYFEPRRVCVNTLGAYLAERDAKREARREHEDTRGRVLARRAELARRLAAFFGMV